MDKKLKWAEFDAVTIIAIIILLFTTILAYYYEAYFLCGFFCCCIFVLRVDEDRGNSVSSDSKIPGRSITDQYQNNEDN